MRKARPSNQMEKTATIIKINTFRAICHVGIVVKAIRMSTVIGAVRGKKLNTWAKTPLGFEKMGVVT